ncbi:hypothetical protein COBT_000427, partial [Conglomerata obtusa]
MYIKITLSNITVLHSHYTISNTKKESASYVHEVKTFHDLLFNTCDIIFYKKSILKRSVVGHYELKLSDALLWKSKTCYVWDGLAVGMSKWYRRGKKIGTVDICVEIVEKNKIYEGFKDSVSKIIKNHDVESNTQGENGENDENRVMSKIIKNNDVFNNIKSDYNHTIKNNDDEYTLKNNNDINQIVKNNDDENKLICNNKLQTENKYSDTFENKYSDTSENKTMCSTSKNIETNFDIPNEKKSIFNAIEINNKTINNQENNKNSLFINLENKNGSDLNNKKNLNDKIMNRNSIHDKILEVRNNSISTCSNLSVSKTDLKNLNPKENNFYKNKISTVELFIDSENTTLNTIKNESTITRKPKFDIIKNNNTNENNKKKYEPTSSQEMDTFDCKYEESKIILKKTEELLKIIKDKNYFVDDRTNFLFNTTFLSFLNNDFFSNLQTKIFKLWNSFSEFARGSLFCPYYFSSGLIILDGYYNRKIIADEEMECDSLTCHSENIIRSSQGHTGLKCDNKYYGNKEHRAKSDEELYENIVQHTSSDKKYNENKEHFTKSDEEPYENTGNQSKSDKKYNENKKHFTKSDEELYENTLSKNKSKHINYLKFAHPNNHAKMLSYLKQRKNEEFYKYYIDKYYYAISSYTNKLLLFSIPKRKEIRGIKDDERKQILEFLNINTENLLAINLSTEKSIIPHLIFYDDTEDEIVISFRGTQTHKDALNDLDCGYKEFFEGFSHRGISDLANHYIDKISDIEHFLHLKNTRNILFTGQSLGAAIATLVYITIKEKKLLQGYNCRVISFSSPSILSINLCNKYKEVTNFVFENDIIPRLNCGSLLDLKYLAISVAKEKNTGEFIAKVKEKLLISNLYPKLYLPGKIYHVLRNGNVIEKKFDEFNEIIAHRTLLLDHTLSAILNALNKGKEFRHK